MYTIDQWDDEENSYGVTDLGNNYIGVLNECPNNPKLFANKIYSEIDLTNYLNNKYPTNECSLEIDNNVIQYVQDPTNQMSGKLEIPTNNSTINALINYQIDNNQLNYANSIEINLSNINLNVPQTTQKLKYICIGSTSNVGTKYVKTNFTYISSSINYSIPAGSILVYYKINTNNIEFCMVNNSSTNSQTYNIASRANYIIVSYDVSSRLILLDENENIIFTANDSYGYDNHGIFCNLYNGLLDYSEFM